MVSLLSLLIRMRKFLFFFAIHAISIVAFASFISAAAAAFVTAAAIADGLGPLGMLPQPPTSCFCIYGISTSVRKDATLRILQLQGPPPSSPSPASSSSGGFSAERVRVLTQAESCRSALAEVSRSWKAVAVEVKGINLGPEGRVSSIHLSNADDRGGGGSVGTYVFDFLQLPSAIIKGT